MTVPVVTCRELVMSHNFAAIEEVQRLAWDLPALVIVPAHLLEAICQFRAGMLLGAFVENELVGFTLGLYTADRAVQHMHMMAVLPACQNGQVGTKLMEEYANLARLRGVNAIEWTFDPLIAPNAQLYIHKLQAHVECYSVAAYSAHSTEVGVYNGLPTDRLVMRLYLHCQAGKREKIDWRTWPEALCGVALPNEEFRFSVPADLQQLKSTDMPLALKARFDSRQVFIEALAAGYKVVDFVTDLPNKTCYYLFQK